MNTVEILNKLVSYLRNQYFLAAAVFIEVVLLVTNKALPNEDHRVFEDHYWQIAPLMLAFLQFLYNYKHRPADDECMARIIGAEQLTETIVASLVEFQGTFDVYNAELNTLENRAFWSSLCQCPGISQIRIAVPPHVFKRLEMAVLSDDLRRMLLTFPNKVRVLPIHLPDDGADYAYAMLNSITSDGNTRSTIFMFPKLAPFSSRVSDRPQRKHAPFSIRWQEHDRWTYAHILVDDRSPLLENARAWFAQHWRDDSSYTIEEMHSFADGEPLDVKVLSPAHSVSEADPIWQMRYPSARSVSNADGIDDEYRLMGYSVARSLNSNGYGHGAGEILVRKHGSGKQSPAFIWLPPWGYPDWPKRMQRIDAELGQSASIIHLRKYSVQTDTFSVTEAVRDATALINDIIEHPDHYGARKDRLILAGVSISAFVAAEVAAAFADRVVGLCMLSPVIDVFDALDAYRIPEGLALFTRGVYFGKYRYRINDLRAANSSFLQFFESQAGETFVLDLPLRGAARCSYRHTQANLATLMKRARNRVFIAANQFDHMTPWSAIEMVQAKAEPGKLQVVEFDWSHDIWFKNKFLCEPPESSGKSGWKELFAFARQVATTR